MSAAAKLMPNFLTPGAAAAAQVMFSPFMDGSLKMPTGPSRMPFAEANLFNQMCQSGAVAPSVQMSSSMQGSGGRKTPNQMANTYKFESQPSHSLLMDSRRSPAKQTHFKTESTTPADLSMKNRNQSRNSSPLIDRHENNKNNGSAERNNEGNTAGDAPLNLSKSKQSMTTGSRSSPSISSNHSMITSGINGCRDNYMSSPKASYNRSHSPMSSPSMPSMISSQLSQLSHPPHPPPSAFFGNAGLANNPYFNHAYNALGMGFRGPHMTPDLSSMSNLHNDKSGNPFNPFGPLLLPDLSKLTPTSTVTTATLASQLDRQRNESQQQSQNESNTETIVTCQSKRLYLCCTVSGKEFFLPYVRPALST